MKSIISLLASAMILTACNGTKPHTFHNDSAQTVEESSDQQFTETAVAETSSKQNGTMEGAVKQIYDDILPQYKGTESPDFDKTNRKHCTPGFYELAHKCAIEEEKNKEVLIDFDWWIQAQDFDDNMEMAIEKVENDGMQGYVNIRINAKGKLKSSQISRLFLKNIDGKWLVDDIFYYQDGDWHSSRKLLKALLFP